MRRAATLGWTLIGLMALPAHAQPPELDGLVVPPPPGADATPPSEAPPPETPPSAATPPPPSAATTSPTAPPPSAATTPPAGPPPPGMGVPSDAVVGPLLAIAEQDLAAGRHALALARASVVSQALPENVPLRIRADGLRLIAQQRISANAPAPTAEEVLAPLVIQAEMDLRAGQAFAAVPRIDFVLARLPASSLLRQRAAGLREVAIGATGSPSGAPPLLYAPAPPPTMAMGPAQPPPTPRDPTERGTGEAVELYITGGMLGALTGGYIPFVASEQTAGSVTYTLSVIGGAGLFVVGVISLDLTGALRTGIPPTISSSIRFGFANGMLAWGLAAADGNVDPGTAFTLVWGGSVIGALTGVGVGFGLTPSVDEERFVESAGIWGGAIGTSVAMITGYEDPMAGLALSLVGLDAGLLAGIITTAAGGQMSARRSLFLDLGFLAGYGVGVLLPTAYYTLSRNDPELAAFGVGSLVGSIGGWVLLYLLTDGMDAPAQDDDPQIHVGISPIDGGGVVTLYGQL
ncbi:MAG: hypothetical protein H6719_30935 [Sandaracinaceae bacterium]|nr:hypothetical protein [Sandaracinaceae bacterium]